jgi:putative MATE family efflux protein
MTSSKQPITFISTLFLLIKESFKNEERDYTTGSIKKAIFLLAIPMMAEMIMESIFAVVDIFFVSKLGSEAITIVGLTEGMLTIVYSLAFGIGMSATAVIARRIGEKENEEASKSAAQAISVGFLFSIAIAIIGYFFTEQLLQVMGASKSTIQYGSQYTQILLVGNIVILFIHLLNGIFRGAGNAAIAMRSLLIANAINIVLCPICIHFWGLTGAAIATTTGRGIGVLFQLYNFKKGDGALQIKLHFFKPIKNILQVLLQLCFTNTMQFIIASASWAAMVRIVSINGEDAVAGYTIAIRLLIFFIMPAFGLSNAAATLVGQNLGAKLYDRAEKSVWQVAKYNAIFMAGVTIFFLVGANFFVQLINDSPQVVKTGTLVLQVISSGYIFYGIGMVLMNAFNGAGDSKTPTWVNLICYWCIQIPLGYFLAVHLQTNVLGVCLAIVSIEALITIVYYIIFKRGKWKNVKI